MEAILPPAEEKTISASAAPRAYAKPAKAKPKPAQEQYSTPSVPQAIPTPAPPALTQARNRKALESRPSATLSASKASLDSFRSTQDEPSDKKDASAGLKMEPKSANPVVTEKVAMAYTLTVPAGKRGETLEAIRKLAEELSVTLAREQPDLDMSLAPEGREPLLERLKTLGALTETPPTTSVMDAAPGGLGVTWSYARGGGGGGGFGGGTGGRGAIAPPKLALKARAAPVSKPPLKLTLVIKESEPKKESEPEELP